MTFRKITIVAQQTQFIVNQGVCTSYYFIPIEKAFCTNFFFLYIIIGRSVGVGPMRRPGDRRIDTSPYSSGNIAYLSPPSDSSWRRTSSDSAIHQSLTQNMVYFQLTN